VDNSDLGVTSLPAAEAAIAVTWSEPSSCNANGSAEDLYAAAPGQKRGVKLIGATHCDPEKNADLFGCTLLCGSWNAERHERYLRYLTGWFEYHLRCDEGYEPWVWGSHVAQDLADGLIVYQRRLAPEPPLGLTAEAASGGILLRRDAPASCVGVDGWRVYRDSGAGLALVADDLPPGQIEWLDDTAMPGTLYDYVARDYLADFAGEEESADSAIASGAFPPPTSVPQEASGPGEPPLIVSRVFGSAIEASYAPAPCASDHTVYWGVSQGPLASGPVWSGQSCGIGVSGSAVFDPGPGTSETVFYFVIVGNDGLFEGSYGRRSNGPERSGATGLPDCGYTQFLAGACEP
jgi:hypothetical protein